jgi:hypothetical protein
MALSFISMVLVTIAVVAQGSSLDILIEDTTLLHTTAVRTDNLRVQYARTDSLKNTTCCE